MTGAVCVPSTDWVGERLERESAGVEGSCVSWMRGVLFAVGEVSEGESEWDGKWLLSVASGGGVRAMDSAVLCMGDVQLV